MVVVLEVGVELHVAEVHVRRLKIHNVLRGCAEKLVGIRVACIRIRAIIGFRCRIFEGGCESAEVDLIQLLVV